MKLIINLIFYLISYFTFIFKVIFNCLSLSYINSLIYSFRRVFELIKSGYNLLVGEIINGILSLYKYFKSFKKLVNIIMYIVIRSYLYYKYLILTTVSTVKKIKEKINTSKSFCFIFFLNLIIMSFLISIFLIELIRLNIFSKGDDILVFFLSCCILVLIVAATIGAISAISIICFLIIKGSMQLAFNLYYFILEKSSLLYGFLQDKYSLGFTGLYSKICEYFKLKCKILHRLLGRAACYVCSEFIKCWASFFDWLFNTFFFKHLNNLLNIISYLFTIISEELKFIVLVTISPIKSIIFLSIIYIFKPTFYKIRSSNIYMNTFGRIEGVFYRF